MAKDLKPKHPRENPGSRIPAVFVHGMLSGLVSKGLEVDGYLRQVGVSPQTLHSSDSAGLTAMQYIALFHALRTDLKDEALGLLSRPLKIGSFALLARAGLGAPDLRTALKRICNTINVLQDDVWFSLQCSGDEAALDMRWIGTQAAQAPVFLQETLIRVSWRLASWLLNLPLAVLHFDFSYPAPAQQQDYSLVFPAARRYQQASFGFWFKSAELQTPISRDENALRDFLSDAYAQVISPPRAFGPVSQKVRNCLMHHYPQWLKLQDVAQKLHTTPSTLQRHLAAERTSLQWLKDDLRRDLAISRLSTTRLTLTQLASELGFSDSPSFQRAFKHWTGQRCGAYRRHP